MFLTLREREKLLIFTAAEVASRRRERGLKLNFPEATALIAASIIEGARDGKTVAELMVAATKILAENEVMEGVARMIETVQVEAAFDDGTKLVSVHNPIVTAAAETVGEYLIDDGEIALNEAKNAIEISVENRGDRPVQIGSHFHFFEVNRALKFDREKAYGKRLDIPAGTSSRFEPGSIKQIALIDFAGKRFISGFNALVEGYLDDPIVKEKAMNNL